MTDLTDILCAYIERNSRDDEIAVLLSAGIDSLSTALACREVGKTVYAYTYELDNFQSRERERVEAIARHFGFPLKVITVPTCESAAAFKRLAIEDRSKKKVHFEVGLPMRYVLPEVEQSEVWTGWNADDHYGNTRNYVLTQARLKRDGLSNEERAIHFRNHRTSVFAEFDRDGSGHTFWIASRMAERLGKRFLDPYADLAVREYYLRFSHEQLSSPGKPLVRKVLTPWLKNLPLPWIARGERLQKGGRVHELLPSLLSNTDINRFETKYTTVAALCQRWGRQVASDPARFLPELADLAPQTRAACRTSRVAEYRPYMMEDVRAASGQRKFNFISTFAGGGGSSIGFRLAGGVCLIANDFVPEAARTYRTNFPECLIDRRDIRLISGSDDAVGDLLASVNLKPSEIDILDGSPPCCEFSTAGGGIGDQDRLRPYSDVWQNNIASLPFDLAELAHRILPKVLVCENVPAFRTRGSDAFDRFMDALRFKAQRRVFYAHAAVLIASEYGVPQKRQRLFIIGVRRELGDLLGINSDEAVQGVFPAPAQSGITVRSALTNLHQTPEEFWPWTRSAMIKPLGRLIRLLPKNPPKPTRLPHLYPGYTKHYTLTRCAWDKPAPTLVVTGQRPDGLTGAIHPEEDRKFTLPELKRLTGLPDDFVLTGTLGQAAERVCRMVPPFLTKAIAESVYQKILRPYSEIKK